MRRTHRRPHAWIRFTSLSVCFALLFSAAAGIPVCSASGRESTRVRSQEQHGNERRITPAPPRTGPPAPNVPNLDQVKHQQIPAPRASITRPPGCVRYKIKSPLSAKTNSESTLQVPIRSRTDAQQDDTQAGHHRIHAYFMNACVSK